eukprot:scaffold6599_cov61-Cyclotella_meneghiniana.AAC.2
MVVTRGGNYNAHGEEKKDDDEPIVLDSQQFTSEHKTTEENNLSVKQKKNASIQQDTKQVQRKSPLLLLVCAIGITSCYLWYGTVQETLNSNREKESITLFLLATGTFSSFLLASIWTTVGQQILTTGSSHHDEKKAGNLNHILLIVTSTTYLSAMSASNESLHYVSYPTCVTRHTTLKQSVNNSSFQVLCKRVLISELKDYVVISNA